MMAIRYPFLFFLWLTGKLPSLLERANYLEVGVTGHISALDESISKEKELKPLTRFEQWLIRPIIKTEKEVRQEAFRLAVIKVTGEDPNSWT